MLWPICFVYDYLPLFLVIPSVPLKLLLLHSLFLFRSYIYIYIAFNLMLFLYLFHCLTINQLLTIMDPWHKVFRHGEMTAWCRHSYHVILRAYLMPKLIVSRILHHHYQYRFRRCNVNSITKRKTSLFIKYDQGTSRFIYCARIFTLLTSSFSQLIDINHSTDNQEAGQNSFRKKWII